MVKVCGVHLQLFLSIWTELNLQIVVVWMRQAPLSRIFEYLVSNWWNCSGRIRRCGLIGGHWLLSSESISKLPINSFFYNFLVIVGCHSSRKVTKHKPMPKLYFKKKVLLFLKRVRKKKATTSLKQHLFLLYCSLGRSISIWNQQ